jgi:spore coat polysaccharide biosynthesis protein SpsF
MVDVQYGSVMMVSSRVVLILQARMGSTRLPNKSTLPLAGAPLVSRIVERLQRCARVDDLVLATTQRSDDDVLESLSRDIGVHVFRGSENDLVDRYYKAAIEFSADLVVRLPADNPAVEPSEVDRIIDYHLQSDLDFSSNIIDFMGNRYPDGIGAEVFDLSSLEWVWRETHDPFHREHLATNFYDYIGQKPAPTNRFRVGTVSCPEEFSRPDIVLDVNTASDYAFMSELYEALYTKDSQFHITDVIDWIDNVYRKGVAT